MPCRQPEEERPPLLQLVQQVHRIGMERPNRPVWADSTPDLLWLVHPMHMAPPAEGNLHGDHS